MNGKKILSLILCFVLIIGAFECNIIKTKAETEYLLYDDFEYFLAENTAPLAYSSDFKGNRLLEVDGTVTETFVKRDEGKGSNVFFISTKGYKSTKRKEACIDYRYLPEVTKGDVTCEFSICAPVSNSDKAVARFTFPVNNAIPILACFDNENNIIINEKTYAKWEAGKWYNIAVTVHIDEDVCDIYLNGICVDKGVILESAPDGIEVIGGRVKASLMMLAADESVDAIVGYDDIRIYKGDYSPAVFAVKSTKALTVLDDYKRIYSGTEITAEEFTKEFEYQATVYSDKTYSKTETGYVKDGEWAVIAYPDGVAAYEIIKPVAFDSKQETGFDFLTEREITKKFNSQAHPRIIINEDKISRLKSLKQTDYVVNKLYSKVVRLAEKYITAEEIAYSTDADTALATARTVRDHVFYLGMAYLLTEDECYAERVWKDLKKAGEFPDWSPSLKYLITCEMMSAFGVAYDWLYNYWNDEQREFIEKSIVNLGIYNSLLGYTGRLKGISSSSTWPYNEGNWNAVCNGGTLIAATAIFETSPLLCSVVVSDAIRGLGYMMNSFAPDGAWEEGAGYWSYMIRYLSVTLDTIIHNYNYDFGFDDAEGLSDTVEFIRSVYGSKGINNFHDVDYSEGDFSCDYLYWFADHLNSIEYFNERTRQIEQGAGSVYDLMFYNIDKDYANKENLNLKDSYFRNVEFVSMRSGYTDDSLYLSYHGGKTVCSHSHADSGSFVFDMLGERWAVDLGPDSYSLPYYHGSKRFEYYRTRTEGHNTLLINPDSGAGQRLEGVTYAGMPVDKGDYVYSAIDLTDAYSDDASSVKRAFMLSDNRTNIVMRDEISLKSLSDIYWFMHTDANINIIDSNTAKLTKNNKSITVKLLSDAETAAFSVMDATPLPSSPQYSGQNKNEGFKKLTVTAKESGDVYFQVSFSADESFVFSDIEISEWDSIESSILLSEDYEDGIHDGIVQKGNVILANAEYGKNSKALILEKDSSVKYELPANSFDKVTLEFSLRALPGTEVISGENLLISCNQGMIEFLGEEVKSYSENYWYNFAVEATNEKSVLYVNGEYVAEGEGLDISDIVLNGNNRAFFDDLKVYQGGYSSKVNEISFNHSYYCENDTIFIPCEIESEKLKNAVISDMEMTVYSNLINETESDVVNKDTVAVSRSKDSSILKYYNISTDVKKEDILYCDMEKAKTLSDNKALTATMYTGNISSTGLSNINKVTTTTSVYDSGSGKSGVSYYFNKTNCTDSDEMMLDFKFIPTVNDGTVTFEVSVKAPSGTHENKDKLTVYIPYNSTYRRMIVFDNDGFISFNNQKIEKYNSGQWYNFAVSLHIGSKKADFYMNGVWLGKNELWSYHNSDKIDSVGGRLRLSSQIIGLAEGDLYTGNSAYDDVKVYHGEYYPELNTPQLVIDGKKCDDLIMNTSHSSDAVIRKLQGSKGEIKIFADNGFNPLPFEYVSDGQLLTLATDTIVRHYTVNAKTGLSLKGNAVTATANGLNTLYLADYDGDSLASVKAYEFCDKFSINTDDSFDTVYLWDTSSFAPVCEQMNIPDDYWD